ncbi:MAG: hypothetical protein OEM25_08050 [Gammaproteobacteria bacterium]|nr:hypothetical protein [Gammaproteobacteria bacterium]
MMLVAACAAQEQLLGKSAVVPVGLDLSGTWQLRTDSQEGIRRGLSSDSALVNVFLETGELLKLTQTDFGLFVSFDRSVVEEYRFGEHRTVNVGPIEAERVSGWEGQRYVIETLDKDGAKLIDSYRLVADGVQLMRTFKVTRRDTVQVDVEQVFDRAF